MPLTTHSIGILISRIFGLYILISMLGYIQPSALFPIWLTVLAFLLHVALGLFFLSQAPRISGYLMSGTNSSESDSHLSLDQLTTLALVIIGILTIVRVLPLFVGELIVQLFPVRGVERPNFFIIRHFLELALGIWLTVGTQSILRLIKRFRSME